MTTDPRAVLDRLHSAQGALYAGDDTEPVRAVLTEDVVWHVPGQNITSGDYRGREDVLALFAKSVQIAVPDFDIHDVDASDDHVVVLMTVRWRRNDTNDTYEGRIGQVFHLDGGRVLEVWTMGEDLAGFDRFLEGVSG